MSGEYKIRIGVRCLTELQEIPYQIRALAREWRAAGHDVAVGDNPRALEDADVAVHHVDLTVTPRPWRRAFAQAPVAVNGAVLDISKRRTSTHRVRGPDDGTGPVIVKSDRNCGGLPELSALGRSGPLGRYAAKAAGRLPWQVSGLMGYSEYPIYDAPSAVPWWVWRNPRLVVERLKTEQADGLFCLRQYVFFGDREVVAAAWSPHPVVKAADVVRRERLDAPPPEVVALRHALGFDFGKFDYVISDGEVVVFDVNRTPTFADLDSEVSREVAAELAGGLDACVEARAAGLQAAE